MADTVLLLSEMKGVMEKSFGLSMENLEPVRRVYKVFTNQGVRGLHNAPDETRLRFLDAVIRHARKNGFSRMPSIYKNKRGSFIVTFQDEPRFLMEWIEGKEAHLGDDQQLMAAAVMYAEFHNAMRGFTPRSDNWNNLGKWPDNFNRRLNDLKTIEKIISEKNSPDEFDRLVSENIDYFLDQAEIALKLLDEASYNDAVKKARKSSSVIHHSCYSHNLIYSPDDKMYLVDYGKMIFDLPIHDVANFVIRHIRHHDWSRERAEIILKGYSSVRPISTQEKVLLKALFHFPQKFWKVAAKHYISQHSDPHLLTSMERVIKEQPGKKALLEEFDNLQYE